MSDNIEIYDLKWRPFPEELAKAIEAARDAGTTTVLTVASKKIAAIVPVGPGTWNEGLGEAS